MRHLTDAIFHTEIADTYRHEVWKEKGEKDTQQRAREKIKEIISNHRPEPLDEAIEKKLRAYVAEVERRNGLTDKS